MRHFLDIADHGTDELKAIVDSAVAMKSGASPHASLLEGRTVAMIFQKPSTRTRVSFEVGIRQLGAAPVVLRTEETQLGRGESIPDTARVLSRYVDAIMIRTSEHGILTDLAEHAEVPVVNGLTDKTHPCQVMADTMTLAERKAPGQDYSGIKVAWLGDGNNVANSWIEAAAGFGFGLDLAVPPAFKPDKGILDAALAKGARVAVTDDPGAAARDADVVATDTWSSMGIERSASNSGDAAAVLEPYRVDKALMAKAKPDAVFMHCLPVYRGQEAAAEVVDGPQSVIWDEAENRLHVQKAIIAHCLLGGVKR